MNESFSAFSNLWSPLWSLDTSREHPHSSTCKFRFTNKSYLIFTPDYLNPKLIPLVSGVEKMNSINFASGGIGTD